MSDFHQSGVVTTLQWLYDESDVDAAGRLEKEVASWAKTRPIALVLPSLYSELEGPALPGILEELKTVSYLNEVVVALDNANEEEFDKAKKFFSALKPKPMLIWNNGPRISGLRQVLEENGLSLGPQGKGRSTWVAYGYVLAGGKSEVIALHDCDIVTYTKNILTRLVYPIVNSNLDYEFVKGYYARATDRLHGRVVRLFMTPVLRSLIKLVGPDPFLVYLDSFRYLLAGEFAMTVDLAHSNRIPSDWGLEVGTLAEVWRNASLRTIAQVDVAPRYEHKHQDLSSDSPERGLHKMSIDIAKTLFRTLASEGVALHDGIFRSLQVTYLREAQDTIARYGAVAALNGFEFDRHQEEQAVDTFERAILEAVAAFKEDPAGANPPTPNWNRVTSALPDFLGRLEEAVRLDNE